MRQAIDLYKNYGVYTNTDKMLPSAIDGLLPVHRRLLFVLNNIASNSKQKTSTIIGELFKYHPHDIKTGPVAWAVKNDFAIGYGQWGSSIGIEEIPPAAPRYTEAKAHPWVTKNSLNLVKYVKWKDGESDDYKEPTFLPTLFPFCLMGNEELSMIGFGIKTEHPVYKKLDLCKRLLYVLGKTTTDCVIKPNIPNCEILSPRKDIKKLLTKGEVSLSVKGIYTEDKKNKIIYIKGWPPRTKFEAIYKKIMDYKDYDLTESIGMIDESNIDSGTNIRFEVLKQRNTMDIYNHMKAAIDSALCSNVRYSMYVVEKDNKTFTIKSVDEMLLSCYEFYKNTYKTYCEDNINRIKDTLHEYSIIELIRPHLSCFDIKKDVDTNVKKLSKLSGASEDDIKVVIDKYKIKKLITFNLDKEEYKLKKKEFEHKLSNLDSSVLTEYKTSLQGN